MIKVRRLQHGWLAKRQDSFAEEEPIIRGRPETDEEIDQRAAWNRARWALDRRANRWLACGGAPPEEQSLAPTGNADPMLMACAMACACMVWLTMMGAE